MSQGPGRRTAFTRTWSWARSLTGADGRPGAGGTGPSTFWTVVEKLRDAGIVEPSDSAEPEDVSWMVPLAQGDARAMLVGHPGHPDGHFLLVTEEGSYRVKGSTAADVLAYIVHGLDGRARGDRPRTELMLWLEIPPLPVVRAVLAVWRSEQLLAPSADGFVLSTAYEPYSLQVSAAGAATGPAAWELERDSLTHGAPRHSVPSTRRPCPTTDSAGHHAASAHDGAPRRRGRGAAA